MKPKELLWKRNTDLMLPGQTEVLIQMLQSELQEAREAQEAFESARTPVEKMIAEKKLFDEKNDVLIVFRALIKRLFEDWMRSQTLPYAVNGDGGRSSVYDDLLQLSGNLKSLADMMYFLELLQSADLHWPKRNGAVTTIGKTLQKVNGNYPAEFLQSTTSSGRLMNPDEQELRLAFIKRALRMVRDFVNQRPHGERHLKPDDLAPYKFLLMYGHEETPNVSMAVLYSLLALDNQPPTASPPDPFKVLLPSPVPRKYQLLEN